MAFALFRPYTIKRKPDSSLPDNASVSTLPSAPDSSLASISSPSSAQASASAVDWNKLFADFGQSLNTTFESMAASALDAEFAAAAKQMQFQREQNKAAMDFEARQNEINRIFQQNSAERAMSFEAEQSQLSRDFQERMSNTSYRRAVADLQAAGLNPILAVSQGGASSPAGAAGSGFTAGGSAASGVTSSGSKANAAQGKSSDTQVLSTIINSAASLLHAIGEIIPG